MSDLPSSAHGMPFSSYAAVKRAVDSNSGMPRNVLGPGPRKVDTEVSQVLFRLSRWENLEYAKKI